MDRRTILFLLMASPAFAAEKPVAPEASPPGDIPDSQVFIRFESPEGFSIKVPEGWARKDDGRTVVFSDKYNHITLAARDSAQTVDEAYAKSTLLPELQKTGHAISKVTVSTVKLKAGAMVKFAYDSNSEPNAVTNKQVREENEMFFYAGKGKLVQLTLSAPKGADNVDQWKLISSSFRWK